MHRKQPAATTSIGKDLSEKLTKPQIPFLQVTMKLTSITQHSTSRLLKYMKSGKHLPWLRQQRALGLTTSLATLALTTCAAFYWKLACSTAKGLIYTSHFSRVALQRINATPNLFECDLAVTSFYTSTCVNLYLIAPPRFDIGHTNSLCIIEKMVPNVQKVVSVLTASCTMREADNNDKLPSIIAHIWEVYNFSRMALDLMRRIKPSRNLVADAT